MSMKPEHATAFANLVHAELALRLGRAALCRTYCDRAVAITPDARHIAELLHRVSRLVESGALDAMEATAAKGVVL